MNAFHMFLQGVDLEVEEEALANLLVTNGEETPGGKEQRRELGTVVFTFFPLSRDASSVFLFDSICFDTPRASFFFYSVFNLILCICNFITRSIGPYTPHWGGFSRVYSGKNIFISSWMVYIRCAPPKDAQSVWYFYLTGEWCYSILAQIRKPSKGGSLRPRGWLIIPY